MQALTDLILGVVLGAVQGLTEFFPVSSSGHLVIIEKLAGWAGFEVPDESVAIVVAVHGASLAAIVVAMWADLRRIVQFERKTILMLLLATVPVGLVGVFFKSRVEELFGSLLTVGVALIVTGVVLFIIELRKPGERSIGDVGVMKALLIGCAQALAVVPGLSRSGCTICAGLGSGLARDQAVRFSFLMAIPAIGGVCAYECLKAVTGSVEASTGFSWPLFAGGVISSFVFSLLAMKVLLKLVRRHKLSWFSLWCIPLGIIVLLVSFL